MCTPKPSMNRNDRGIARSDIVHITMWVASGISEMKSQKLSCADCACGKPRSGCLLHGVDEVGELDRVLDEEHRDVVADEIPVALLRVELHGEAADVAGEVERALVAGHRREAHEHRGALAGPLEQVGARAASASDSYGSKKPCAPKPRACTTRSGMRSWSKWKIFSRKWKSSSSDGPRSPTFNVFWSSATGTPCCVVSRGRAPARPGGSRRPIRSRRSTRRRRRRCRLRRLPAPTACVECSGRLVDETT